MDLEETLRANPLNAVVLLAGCDKISDARMSGTSYGTVVLHVERVLGADLDFRRGGSGADVPRQAF